MNQIEIYKTPDNKIELQVNLESETVWLTQKQMALLFDCSSDNISLHLKNIFKTEELIPNSVTEDSSVTATDGKKYKTKYYNLDAIISVGYRVNSKQGTQFRQWATQRLKDYLANFVDEEELDKNQTVRKFRTVQLKETSEIFKCLKMRELNTINFATLNE